MAKKDLKKVYSYINNRNTTKSTIKSMKLNGIVESDSLIVADGLNNYFSNVFNKDNGDELPNFSVRTNTSLTPNLDNDINYTSIKNRLEQLDGNKSSGPNDDVSSYFLKHNANSLAIPLSILFKKSLL
ncbi:unnamed protein product [Brachionus calyciflorus]|uniref:Uncharacterized protein n=1 Tax=Brachionus calyciflorus TaxID=104777 RepID=A0A814K6G7_9BILA|nr:unnamed protein product [Brachionus calyciflorus]